MIIDIISIGLTVFFAVVLHECAHGWMANKLGDPTAKEAGRLTLNPLKHIDPVGTIILPGILIAMRMLGYPSVIFGWAKPVPVNFSRLRHPKRDMMWVGLAGPAVNIILAVIASQLIRINLPLKTFDTLYDIVIINLILAIFNMIPVPPLDGSRLVAGLLPDALARPYMRLEPYGLVIVFGLLYLGAFKHVVVPIVDQLSNLLGVNVP